LFWTNVFDPGVPATVGVTFDDPTYIAAPPAALCDFVEAFDGPGEHCGTGDFTLPAITGFASLRIPQFPVPGTYTYHTSTGIYRADRCRR